MLIKNYQEIINASGLRDEHAGYIFQKVLDKYLTPGVSVLDVGCGRGAFGAEFYKRARRVVGVDPDREALEQNQVVHEKVCSNIEEIPDNLGEFDVVIAQWVFEHLADPGSVVKKLQKLCRPGGVVIFMTSNIYSPIMLISKVMSTRAKKSFKSDYLDVDEEDTYPTHYRLNSQGKIEKLFRRFGFERVEFHRVGVYNYFGFNTVVLRAKIFFDKAFSLFPFSRFFASHLIGVYRKVK